ncbi:MAG: caspase family protein [Actinomycetota bacterium]
MPGTGPRNRLRRAHALTILLVLAGALTTLIVQDPGGRANASRTAREAAAAMTSTPMPGVVVGRAPTTKIDTSDLFTSREGRRRYVGASGPRLRFGDVFPAQTVAYVDPAVPATNYWALLIGINDYAPGTRDNVGSYQDARDLRKYLLKLGWKSDHIVLLANRTATASMIEQSINWLASKTDGASTVIFNYSGHEEPRHYGGTRHIMLHAADNRFIADTQVARALGRVSAAKMWINLAVCRAGGFNDPGLVKAGRVVTFSSPERELSYEDPRVDHSVFGWYMIMESMVYGYADANEDGRISAEEAFRYAKSRVTARTSGAQHPFIVDKLSGNFYLKPPKPAPPAPAPEGTTSSGCLIGC